MPKDVRGGIDNDRPIPRDRGRQAEVGLMPPADRTPVDRPFGIGGVCNGPVAHNGRPRDSSLAGARPRSDGG
eukprot:3353868-Alexandrium_andersonii.AAC.1